MTLRRRMLRALLFVAGLIITVLVGISIAVQREATYVREDLGGRSSQAALILYHPSRDAGFSDELSMALADGLKSPGYRVDRATLTSQTPGEVADYALVAVVTNTYYASPDRPTLRYLARVHWAGTPVIGVIGGAGSTEQAERVFGGALRSTGATVLATRAFWLWRPNDERRMQEPNRAVARDLAARFGEEMGKQVASPDGEGGK